MEVLDRPKKLEAEELGAGLGGMSFSAAVQNSTPTDESLPGYIYSKFNELGFIKFAFFSFVVNNLRRRYQRSVLGFAWSMLNPLLMMIVLTTIFSLLFNRDPRSYGIYMLTGLLPWQFISESISGGCGSLIGAEAFMKKVYVPKLFFPLVTCSTEVVNFVFALSSMMVLATFLGLKVGPSFIVLPLAMVITFGFAFGLTLCVSVATVYFRDLNHIIGVVLQCFFYFIPIIWPLNALPKQYLGLFMANPFTQFIMLFRTIIFDGQFPSVELWGWTTFYAVISIFCGFWILKRNEKDIIFRL